MSSKRSRVVRSSSQGEIGLFNQLQPIESPVALFQRKNPAPITTTSSASKPVKESQPTHRQCIFSLDTPENQKNELTLYANKEYGKGFGEFLKACSLCKKKLDGGQSLYMYGYLGAFCSRECREDRMALDGFDKEVAEELSKRAAKYAPRLGFKLN
ncbi:hypothetical protein JCGZ_02206 [Jatropha curcas]|uniref:FLZ-type domain-containing protein n=1 Tax=Jatropha curcas TaxID=180498 RepID=A0A067KZ57_JATCU|nr:FCS-Like Zinc finger 2 [Jatropha curcas]KDP40208.1 hypothetical protein JCGZ_02206 [Jatropha curcas]